MILFCPACGDELEGFDPTYAREWPRHCGEQMVRLREDDKPSKALPVPVTQPVEHLPSDDPGVMMVQVPDKWWLEPVDDKAAAERMGKAVAALYQDAMTWFYDFYINDQMKKAVLHRIADQINAMIDGRVTHG